MTGAWLVRPRLRPGTDSPARPIARLVCFPYAGGSPYLFRTWPHLLAPAGIDVVIVQLPGRGARHREAPCPSIESMVAGIVPALAQEADVPCSFFGYSMGAVVAYECALALAQGDRTDLTSLVVAAARPPDDSSPRNPIGHLPDDRLLDAVYGLGGTPQWAMENRELMAFAVGALRGDLQAIESYRWREAPPLACPIVALGGRGDTSVSPEQLAGWARRTSGSFQRHLFEGGHFVVAEHERAIVDIIRARIKDLVPRP